jgi:hypothetical protein
VDVDPLKPVSTSLVATANRKPAEGSKKAAPKEDGMENPVTRRLRSSRPSQPNLGNCLRVASTSAVAALLLFVNMGLDAEPSRARLAILSSISYDQADRSVSIILHLDDHRPFTLGKLDTGLYLDIENTRLAPELLAGDTRLPSNSEVQVKTHQLRKDTARVVFHFDALARIQAVPLKAPSRILVEIDLPELSTETGDSLSASARALKTKK